MDTKNRKNYEDEQEKFLDKQEEIISGPTFISWLVTTILILIPIFNYLYVFEIASGHTKHPEKINFAKAMILWMIIIHLVIFAVLLYII